MEAKYLKETMDGLGIKIRDIVTETGLDRSMVSAWVNGLRDMSKNVSTMLDIYFKYKRLCLTYKRLLNEAEGRNIGNDLSGSKFSDYWMKEANL